ncbi:DoxX family protein [Cohnella zeiphila]|uniref:DoxX family protein n=1 Tax=Cohnella zeiphila TaxID=2761120 RepID=A0A7X0SPM6_9BACL|nr:DoxX family protein [Cohnella zeiphila]MBB6731538.1 DoxX family protein [Cohnella zeiphila]
MGGGISRGRLWTARFMSGIVVLFMLVDGIGKMIKPAQVVKSTIELGFAERLVTTIGILGLISTLFYAVPRTRFLGALLLTGYYGGAVAVQLRLDNPLFSNVLFPVYTAILVWGALWLRDERVRKLFWRS